ncbi:MAG: ribonuclease Z [Clostridia bacterium]|nr:ribonuclease Z [Clostridia bacterium]
MKIHFLGTCAGTEPIAGVHHASFTITVSDRVYWFDAGECCSYTAHLLGVDLLSVCKIVISHTHMDHIGGLGNLLWNIRKLTYVKKQEPVFSDIDLYIPKLESYRGLEMLLNNTEGGFQKNFNILPHKTEDGVLFDDGFMRVTALHNSHRQREEVDGEHLSFSFLIEAEGKKIVYTGDTGEYTDIDPLLCGRVDALIGETGHFTVEEVYDYTKDKEIDKMIFFHNNGVIVKDFEGAKQKVEKLFEGKAVISYDGLCLDM